ncbi:hypothetical protein [Deinococcus hopiensis]|uniref:hypothetical protein n=1 Tax=Deinococcus hopiensis TaxID=309885 RepID=UPI000A019D1C|nr:hypothetical protein [Deinococcus hopiensis]
MKLLLNVLSLTLLVSAACSSGSAPGPGTDPKPPTALTFTTVDTLAGQAGVRGSADGKGSQATFNYPLGLAATQAVGAKNGEVLLYIAGLTENIRYAQVGHADNPVGTAIGKGESGSVDGGPGTAKVLSPQGIAVGYDADEAYAYWTEDASGVVRRPSAYPVSGSRKAVTVVGQAYKCGAADGPATSAGFNRPDGIVANRRTGEGFVADTSNFTLWRVFANTVSTIAGVAGQQGSMDGRLGAARFASPRGLAMDRAENLYVTECRHCPQSHAQGRGLDPGRQGGRGGEREWPGPEGPIRKTDGSCRG